MELLLSRETRLVLGQKMYQSMNFLRMGIGELESCLSELNQENPILERDESFTPIGRTESYDYSGPAVHSADVDIASLVPGKKQNTLRQSLEEQIVSSGISAETAAVLRFLIINLDSKGYLGDQVRASACRVFGEDRTKDAVAVLQRLEPVGVGARDVSDCLCIQLRALGLEDSVEYRICESYLDHLARSHFNHISRTLGVSEQEVTRAWKAIRALNPIPANGFDDGGEMIPVIPEIQVSLVEGKPVVTLIDRMAYRYSLNEGYCSMADDAGLSYEDREYIREKISQAQWVINCVRHRSDTLLRCAEAIVEAQPDFFIDNSPLYPLSMTEVADGMGVHPSTVSRAVKDKYLTCKWGTFPLSFFFAYEVNGDTGDEILRAIRALISQEDPLRPLSDQAISDALSERGYSVARRTVAKYRDKAAIPPATGRKKRGPEAAGKKIY